jgi:hypothetical protein
MTESIATDIKESSNIVITVRGGRCDINGQDMLGVIAKRNHREETQET